MSLPSAHVSQGSVDQPEAKKTSGRAEHPVDIQFKRLQDKVLPESPYILSTKTTYCLEPQYRDFWRNGTLFDRDEEELQFLTFKDRSHDLMPGFYCRGGWDDGKGKIAPPEEPYSRTSSDGTPRHGQAPKKKISLADYNKRDRTKAAVTASKPTSPKPKVDKIGDEKVTQPRVIAIATKPQQTEQHGQKRYHLRALRYSK